MVTIISLSLLLLSVALSLGGGLYEVLVIYPNWKYDVDPQTLRGRLESSGQMNAGSRFWPLVSPAQGLLSIANIILAWNYTGAAHDYWLAAAITIFVNRLITFSYFIPVMIRKIMEPEQFEAGRLKSIVRTWTTLSPWRLLPEFTAFGLLVAALVLLK